MKPVLKTLQATSETSLPYIVDSVQANVSKVIGQLANSGITDSVVVEDVSITTNDSVLNHGLGRAARGWIVIGKNAASDIFESGSENPSPNTILILKATANVTASFLIF